MDVLRKGRPDEHYIRRMTDFENQFTPWGKRFDEGPPAKKGAGISLGSLTRAARIFIDQFKKWRRK